MRHVGTVLLLNKRNGTQGVAEWLPETTQPGTRHHAATTLAFNKLNSKYASDSHQKLSPYCVAT